jgi:coenzyme F420 hydrogenase subunit beta
MGDPQTVEWVVKNDLCIGCGVCKVVCPHKAIKMIYKDDSGIIFPKIDKKICNGCGICLDVCYGFKVDNKLQLRIFNRSPNSILGNYIGSYTGFAKNQALRFNSTSGGVATAFLIHVLEEKLIEGAIVTRMEEGNPPRAKAFIATTTKEILSGTGSKYCPVSLAECLERVENDKRYAIVGLPCHIYGIRKLAEHNPNIRNSIFLYVGILCGGMPSYLGTQYLLKVYDMEKQHIKKLEYRGGGWPGRLFIQSESSGQQKKISISYPEYWQNTFGYFQPYRCTICHDCFNDFSDISCGDAWLPHIMKKDKEGTSLIITRTENGERLLQDALQKGRIQITTINEQDVISSQKGLIQFKNLTLKSRIKLSKTTRKKLPIFDLSRTPAANLANYLTAIDLYLGRTMASKKTLWWLLETYIASKRKVGYFTRRLKRHTT